ncbi:MAG: hypothetical protein ACOCZ5_01745 [bacterium]
MLKLNKSYCFGNSIFTILGIEYLVTHRIISIDEICQSVNCTVYTLKTFIGEELRYEENNKNNRSIHTT